jgi:aminopeptidase N
MILTLDDKNPQIAARLATGMGTWRRFSPARQDLMKAELERILAKDKLSHNTYEMVSKSLA